jgi:hypothetical protein
MVLAEARAGFGVRKGWMITYHNECLAAGKLVGWQRADAEKDLLANVDHLKATGGQNVNGGGSLASNDNALVRNKGSNLLRSLGPDALGGCVLENFVSYILGKRWDGMGEYCYIPWG